MRCTQETVFSKLLLAFSIYIFFIKEFDVNALKLAYDEVLPPPGSEQDLPPVVLIHAIGFWRKTYKQVMPEISRLTGRKVYTIDIRNHGDSPWVDELSWTAAEEDVNEFLDDNSISKAIIVGHSMGGKIAMSIALNQPDRVEKLIVEDMKPANITKGDLSMVRLFFRMIRSIANGMPQGADKSQAQKYFKEQLNFLVQALFRTDKVDLDMIPVRKVGEKYDWNADVDRFLKYSYTPAVYQHLEGVYDGEALFLYGTSSPFRVYRDKLIDQFFPNATKIPLTGGIHLLHWQFPEEYVRHVTNFINGESSDER